ncbi:MAG: acylneuraminate cytidylyltransferase family protein [Verrucomicrobiota bacterium]
MNIVAMIPARGGSKGIPKKNLRSLGGTPLLQLAYECALNSGDLDRIILSTDSEDIARLGRTIGLEVPFMRPPNIAEDNTPMNAVIEHCLDWLESQNQLPDVMALLQPTSPLRRPEHLRQGVELMKQNDCDSVVSVVEIPQHYAPHFSLKINANGLLDFYAPEARFITRRQDVPKAYSRDGTLYLFKTQSFRKYGDIYGERSLPLTIPTRESINLDTLEDWNEAQQRVSDISTGTE